MLTCYFVYYNIWSVITLSKVDWETISIHYNILDNNMQCEAIKYFSN